MSKARLRTMTWLSLSYPPPPTHKKTFIHNLSNSEAEQYPHKNGPWKLGLGYLVIRYPIKKLSCKIQGSGYNPVQTLFGYVHKTVLTNSGHYWSGKDENRFFLKFFNKTVLIKRPRSWSTRPHLGLHDSSIKVSDQEKQDISFMHTHTHAQSTDQRKMLNIFV